jgi:hypothetical protein
VLTTLDAGGLDDGIGDSDVEAYGTLTIGPVAVLWNDHRCEPRFAGGCIITTPPPYTTTIRSGRLWCLLMTRSGCLQLAMMRGNVAVH